MQWDSLKPRKFAFDKPRVCTDPTDPIEETDTVLPENNTKTIVNGQDVSAVTLFWALMSAPRSMSS